MDPFLVDTCHWKFLKKVKFPSGSIVVVDPHVRQGGYTIQSIPTKIWDAWVLKQHENHWGWRNAQLVLTLPGERPVYEYKEGTKIPVHIDVDSGQAGFFDAHGLEDAVIGDEIEALDGVCVTSGLGDGCYELWSLSFPTVNIRQLTLVFLEEAPVSW